MGKRKSLSYSEHEHLALLLREAGSLLRDINKRVGKGLGVRSKASKDAYQLVLKRNRLKSHLKDALIRDCADVDPDTLNSLYDDKQPKGGKLALLRSPKT